MCSVRGFRFDVPVCLKHSHALGDGRALAEVCDAAGHASAFTTSAYLYITIDDDQSLGALFEFA